MSESYPWFSSYPEGVPHEIDPDRFESIPAVLDSVAARFPDRPAYVSMGSAITYQEAADLSCDLAAYLQSLKGLEPGDRVAVMMPNLLQYVVSIFAILRAGFIVVNVNPLYTSREVHGILTDSGAKAAIVVENFAKTLQNALPGTACTNIVVTGAGDLFGWPKRTLASLWIRLRGYVPPYTLPGAVKFRDALAKGRAVGMQPHSIKRTDIAFLQYTGGTTGVPKGAVLTHRNLLANLQQVGVWISSTFKDGEEVALTALPLYHIFSLTATLAFTQIGATMVLIADPRKINDLALQCAKYDFSIIVGVNTLFAALLNNPIFCRHKFKRLKMTAAGGAQVQSAVAERWKKQTGSSILEAYGLTECSPGVCGNIPNAPWDGSVGTPLPSTVVSIRGEDFRDLGFCPEGADPADYTGEICVRGPQVMIGYWNRPEETAQVFCDGWLRTGDMGHLSAKGVLSITDRKKDMILVSGFNVYPNEVEDVIASMPGVLEVGVVGVPSEKSGETVKAVIVRKDPELTVQDVKAFCRTQLTGYKRPKIIVFADSLPKSPVGKILRRELKSIV
ncbi:MAG: Long-chain-fatty-acid--CoA ligase [Burkholderia sp.]|jgi:long-chain acyl-CoA synthetase